MKTLGILGGMSVESTLVYYQQINQQVQEKLKQKEQGRGDIYSPAYSHNAKLIIHSVNFADIAQLQHEGKWQQAGEYLAQRAIELERAGVDGILLATNTMHKVAPIITQDLSVPFLHLVELTAQNLQQNGIKKVGLLGTKFTMTDGFYQTVLADYGIGTVIPSETEQNDIHRIIYDELCQGIILPNSKVIYQNCIKKLGENGAEAVILGCTEIGLLIGQHDVNLPVFDTTQLHITKAVEWILAD